jgi:uncharacterized protein YecT (DUF1311 family)
MERKMDAIRKREFVWLIVSCAIRRSMAGTLDSCAAHFAKVRQMGFPSLRLAAFVLIVAGLSAQTPNQPEKSQSPGECDNAITTADMRACEASLYATAQQQLNAAYQSVMAHLNSGQKEKLRLAQRAWLHFRDSNADFQASRSRGARDRSGFPGQEIPGAPRK